MGTMTAGTVVLPYQVVKGMRLAVQFKNGRRVSVRALGRTQSKHGETYFTGYAIHGRGTERIQLVDVERIISLG